MREDRRRQVKTNKARNGDDIYKKIGSKGGKSNDKTKFTSELGRERALARWEKYREQKEKEKDAREGKHI